MKVVINDDFGGFRISVQAKKDMLEMGCEHLKKIDIDEFFGRHISSLDELDKYGDTPRKDLEYLEILYDWDKKILYEEGEGIRTCEHLIKLIETKGSKYCSGGNALLKIVNIPDDICWEIDDYDGLERIEECHRVFR